MPERSSDTSLKLHQFVKVLVDIWPHVHKETENEDRDQDQIDK